MRLSFSGKTPLKALAPSAKPFSPTRSRLEKPLEAPKRTPSEALVKALEEDSGFGGMTLGEGLCQYQKLVKRFENFSYFATVPVLLPFTLFVETLELHLWISKTEREHLRRNKQNYPFQLVKKVVGLSKEIVCNKLTQFDKLHRRMRALIPDPGAVDTSQSAFSNMVDRWIELGVVAVSNNMIFSYKSGNKPLVLTRKGRRAIKRYTRTHPPGKGGL